MLENGFRPIALGGDHSITYPIMRAIAKQHRGVTILHIDAHGDLYDEFEGDRYSHACPFARIMEEHLCARLVQVGIRTLTPHQREQIARFGVDTHRDAAFRRRRPAGGRRAGLSVDRSRRPRSRVRARRLASRTRRLSVRDVLTMIQSLDGPIVGADVVEFNPAQDLGGVTATVAAKIAREIAGVMLTGVEGLLIAYVSTEARRHGDISENASAA